MSTFWNTTSRLMGEKNVSQSDIARHINKPKNTISRWLKEDIIPSAEAALQIADLLKVDIRYLITGKSLENEEQEIKEILNNPELKKTLGILKQLPQEDIAKFRAAFQAIAALSAADDTSIVGGNAG